MDAAFLAIHIERAGHLGAGIVGHLAGDEHLIGHLREGPDLPVARQIAEKAHQHDQQANDQ